MHAKHFRAKKDDHQIKEFHMDFMFLGPKEVAGQTLACMVVREAETRMTMAAAVPCKTTGTYISERIVAFLHETGCLHGDIIVRSEQEPAVVSIIEEVGKIRAQRGGGSGVYLGIKGKTGEIIVGDAEGVWRTRTIRRKPEAERDGETHTHSWLSGCLGTTGSTTWSQTARHCPR